MTDRRIARGLLARGLLAAGVAALAVPAAAPDAAAVAPTATAWWSASSPAPPPPDVEEGDLLVEGAAGGGAEGAGERGPAPAPSGPSGDDGGHGGATAIAGLRFRVPDGHQADELVLALEGQPPPRTTVHACAATEPFAPARNGSFQDVPSYDCSVGLAGHITDDGDLLFSGVDRLARDGELSVVILPGHVDRLVLAEPGPEALATHDNAFASLSSPSSPGGSATGGSAPTGSLVPAGSDPGRDEPPALHTSDAPGLRSEPGQEAEVADDAAAEQTAELPVVAPSDTEPAQAALPPPPLRGLPATIALGAALGLVAAGFLLPLLRRALPIAVVIGAASEAPVVLGGPGKRRRRGVGRFVAERDGSPPPL